MQWPALRLPWPLPAVAAWIGAWAVCLLSGSAAAALLAGGAAALAVRGTWRRSLVAAGFPLSAAALGALPALPGWAWGVAALPLALAYPVRAWRDAPFFPTPAGVLDGLPAVAPLPDGARVLDAGCGTGDGLRALRRAYPGARLEGVEWSAPLAALARRRCGDAEVERGDMWGRSWAGCDLVYLFQRPESMARAWDKARAELREGAFVASLEFAVPGVKPHARLDAGHRPLWIYRLAPNSRSTAAPPRR